MKIFSLTILLIIWMILTFILAISFIGWILLAPLPNNTGCHKHQSELRSTWMRIGYELKNKITE